MPPAAGRTSLVVVVRRQGRMAGSIDSRLIVVDSWPVMVVHMLLFRINWHQGIVSSSLSRLLWAVRRGRRAELLIARRHGSVTMLLFKMG